MRFHTRRRLRLTRLGAALAITSALFASLGGSPASAAGTARSAPNASPRVSIAGALPDGIYKFHNVNSGMCLDYAEDVDAAWQVDCEDAFDWRVANRFGDTYQLHNADEDNDCLAVPSGRSTNGSQVIVTDCTGANLGNPFFTLQLVPGASATYQLVNTFTGLCAAVGGARNTLGAWVIQWACSTSPEFLWTASAT